MRGTKAKRLRREGKKPGRAPRDELTDGDRKKIDRRIEDAKAPYSERRHVSRGSPFADRIREGIQKRREEKQLTGD